MATVVQSVGRASKLRAMPPTATVARTTQHKSWESKLLYHGLELFAVSPAEAEIISFQIKARCCAFIYLLVAPLIPHCLKVQLIPSLEALDTIFGSSLDS